MKTNFEIDQETADKITVTNLKFYRSYLKKELKEWKKNPQSEGNKTGRWMHPEDVTKSAVSIEALDIIIKEYGG